MFKYEQIRSKKFEIKLFEYFPYLIWQEMARFMINVLNLKQSHQLKFIMQHQGNIRAENARKIEKNYKSGQRITKIKESVDDLHVLIESAKSLINESEPIYCHQPSHSKYHIIIDQEGDRSSIDLSVRIEKKSQESTPKNKKFCFKANLDPSFIDQRPFTTEENWANYQSTKHPIRKELAHNYSSKKNSESYLYRTVASNREKQQKSFGALQKRVKTQSNTAFESSPIAHKIQIAHSEESSDVEEEVNNIRSKDQKNNWTTGFQSFTHSPQVYEYDQDHMVSEEINRYANFAPQGNSKGYQKVDTAPSMTDRVSIRIIDCVNNQGYAEVPNHTASSQQNRLPQKKQTLERIMQNEIQENSPSFKDIPGPTKVEPIVVPINRIPQNKFNSSINLTTASPKTVRVSLRAEHEKRHLQDTFIKQKNHYLSTLKKREKERLSQSQSLRNRNRHSLSPECEQITNRLYRTKINKQPCLKFEKEKDKMQRQKMLGALSNYTFVRRYLSDQQIMDIFTELQYQGVPEYKWPMKVVDIVYSKLSKLKLY